MTINTLIEIVLSYAAIWGPSLVAIFSIVATILGAYTKVKLAVAESKKATEELRSSTEIKELKEQVKSQVLTQEELIRTNKILIDKIAKIQGYADLIKEE